MQKTNANFKIDTFIWKQFLGEVKKDNSDASKKLRDFILNYLKYKESVKKL